MPISRAAPRSIPVARIDSPVRVRRMKYTNATVTATASSAAISLPYGTRTSPASAREPCAYEVGIDW
jgi:hypothetical protein